MARSRNAAGCYDGPLMRSLVALIAVAPLLTGCATLGTARPWAEQATLTPAKRTLGRVIVRTATAPQTWVPLVVAAALQVERMDARATAWASDHTPIFGSRKAADLASSRLADAATVACGLSILAAPSGTQAGEWLTRKLEGGGLDLAAFAVAQGTAAGLKRVTGRTRPDGSDEQSFPSGHATRASVAATLAQRNAHAALGDGAAATASGLGTFALAAACAWSRVEARRHYPADALAGFALGHLVGAIVNDAFVTPALPVSVRVSIAPGRGGAIEVSWRP